MAKFTAAEVVDSLEFDFTVYRPKVPDPDHPDYDRLKRLADEAWSGVTPEPSDAGIERFFNRNLPAVRDIGVDLFDEHITATREARREWFRTNRPNLDADALDADALEALEVPVELRKQERAAYVDVSEKIRETARQATIAAIAEFTQGSPSALVLEALPWRAMQHYLGWLTGQFRPEALAAAMNT